MPAPTQADFEQGIRVFTGERLVSASARHIMGQEAARAAWLLGRTDPAVRNAYDRVTRWMHEIQDFQRQRHLLLRALHTGILETYLGG